MADAFARRLSRLFGKRLHFDLLQRVEFGRRVRASSKSRRVIRPEAIRLDGNMPIGMMPSGLADAAMAAVSSPMPWPPSTKFESDALASLNESDPVS